MRRLLIIAGIIVCLPFVLLLASGLILKAIVTGDASEAALEKLNERLPVVVSTSGGEFDLERWFRLQPALAVNNVLVSNPPGFSNEPMIEADKVSIEVDLQSLLSRAVRVQRVVIREPVVRVETNEAGKTNLAALAPRKSETSEPEEAPSGDGQQIDLAVDGLYIEKATVTFSEPTGAYDFLRIEDLDIDLTDFTPDSRFQFGVDGRLFGGEESRVAFEGSAGPFAPESLPADGVLDLKVAAVEIPQEYRVQQFGNLLRDPGDDSTLEITADMAGDLMKQIAGTGSLRFSEFQLGRDADHRLPVDGEVPLRLTVDTPLGTPALDLQTERASMKLGAGELNSAIDLKLRGGYLQGALDGTIQGVDIDEILSAFSESAGQVYGLAAIRDFHIDFAGSGGEELVESLDATAELTLDEGRITVMNTVERVLDTTETLLRSARAFRSTSRDEEAGGGTEESEAEPVPEPPANETVFTTLFSNLKIDDRVALLNNTEVKTPSGDLTGSGSFTFDGGLDFDLAVHLAGEVAAALGGRKDASGQARLTIPFTVTGTTESPKVKPDVSALVKRTAVDILDRVLSGQDQQEAPEGTEGEEKKSTTRKLLDILRQQTQQRTQETEP